MTYVLFVPRYGYFRATRIGGGAHFTPNAADAHQFDSIRAAKEKAERRDFEVYQVVDLSPITPPVGHVVKSVGCAL